MHSGAKNSAQTFLNEVNIYLTIAKFEKAKLTEILFILD